MIESLFVPSWKIVTSVRRFIRGVSPAERQSQDNRDELPEEHREQVINSPVEQPQDAGDTPVS